MQVNEPAGQNLFDDAKVVGKPSPRIDGPLKVTGTAPYAYERHDAVEGQLYGYPVLATIAKGTILAMDTEAAMAMPGVIDVITAPDVGQMPEPISWNVAPLFGGDAVAHYHQAIAVVVAETFEQARAAAALVETNYDAEELGNLDLGAAWEEVREDRTDASRVGDFKAAFDAAPVTIDRTYSTPSHSHAMMEPPATIAHWEDGKLTIWTSNQMIEWARRSLATTFEMDEADVRVDSPFIGGGFGTKLVLRSDAIMAAQAARRIGRPVKVAMPRPMVMNNTSHRASTIQRIRIGAGQDGRITAIAHEAIAHAMDGGRGENAIAQTRDFYAGANRLVKLHLARMTLPEENAMRAPGEASGLMALEIAMDEMAEALGMDPVQFRILNDTQVHPGDGRPFSDRHFVECLERGAEAFGWADRNTTPGGLTEGDWLIGHGVAGAYRGGPATGSGARLTLTPEGRVIVETSMTDIGTGSYTILAQTAAEVMGVTVAEIEVRLGDSAFPASSGSGGQWGAASSTAGVYAAAVALREAIADHMGRDVDSLTFEGGSVRTPDKQVPLAGLSPEPIVAEDSIAFGDYRREQVVSTFGAHFVEVGVNRYTGETRVRRMLAVCDAGRILNPITARSQVIGGMVMGVGAALMEDAAIDTGRGMFPAHDLAGYEVPVHADIPAQEVIFLDTVDPVSSPLNAKGVGELGLCGVAAAVANAITNATGIRQRDYPVTLDRFLDRMPAT